MRTLSKKVFGPYSFAETQGTPQYERRDSKTIAVTASAIGVTRP